MANLLLQIWGMSSRLFPFSLWGSLAVWIVKNLARCQRSFALPTRTFLAACAVVFFSISSLNANAIEIEKDLIDELTHFEPGEARETYGLETLKVEEFPEHSTLQVVFSGSSIALRLVYDEVALAKPHLLIPDAMLFWYIKNFDAEPVAGLMPKGNTLLENFGPRTTGYAIAEVIQNAQLGNAAAQARLFRWLAAAIEGMEISEKFESQFPGTRAAIAERSLELKRKISKLKTSGRRTWHQEFDAQKLKELVSRNDRAGVAALLNSSFDWASMQPIEKKIWRAWIQAIEKPSHEQAIWLFRGFQDQRAFDRSHVSKFGQDAFFSARIFPTTKQFDIERASLNERSPETVHKFTDLLSGHAGAFAGPSMFMSFSSHFDVSEGFVSGNERFAGSPGSLLAVQIDLRRVLPNAVSSFGREMEYLVPFFVFPDEVRLLVKGYTPDQRAAFIKQIEAKGYRVPPIEKIVSEFRSHSLQLLRVGSSDDSRSNRSCQDILQRIELGRSSQ